MLSASSAPDPMLIDGPCHMAAANMSMTGYSPQELRAVHTIQRCYRLYRLRRLIEELHEHEAWFFHWNRNSPGETNQALSNLPELQLEVLQKKFGEQQFFDKIQRLMELLGSAKSASKCHAKMLLMAFMLNHHGQLPTLEMYREKSHQVCFPELATNINTLGSRFLSVCDQPLCFLSRIRFIVAYSMYSKKFLGWRLQDVQKAINLEARAIVTRVRAMNVLKEKVRSGVLHISKCQVTLQQLRASSERRFKTLADNLGSVERAREVVGQEYKRQKFLTGLRNLEANDPDAKLPDPTPETEILYKNRTRMIVLQRIATKTLASPFMSSREEKVDPEGFKLWHGDNYTNLVHLKDIINNQYDKSQVLWIPKFVDHVRGVMVNKILSDDEEKEKFDQCIDYELVIQQCTMNNFNPSYIMKYFASRMRNYCLDHRVSDLTDVVARLEGSVYPSKDTVFLFLDVLENMRIDANQLCYHINIKSLVPQSKRLEFPMFFKGVVEERTDISNLLKWAALASLDDKCLLPDEIKAAKSSNIDKLARFYSYNIACFPSSESLSTFPETFTMLRMSILRTQMLIRDTVLGFSILQFTIGLSKDKHLACRIKSAIFAILAEEHRHGADETIAKIIDVVGRERPGMTEPERKLLHGLIGRMMGPGCPQEQVPKLALRRIRLAIQQRLFHVEPYNCRMLDHFDGEVKRIVDQVENIWKLSVGLYKPIYEYLIKFSRVWQ